MNSVTLSGRLTRDPELRTTGKGKPVTSFTLAVNKDFGEEGAYFIRCIAWNKTAEFVEKYFKKGSMIGVVGRITTGSYTKDSGETVYTTDVVADRVEFMESRKAAAHVEKAETEDDTEIKIDFDTDQLDNDIVF